MPHLYWPVKPGNSNLGTSSLSAVIVLVHYTYPSPHILLTKRSNKLRSHTGEISFPGGRFITEDETLLNTVIRETDEEIGIRLAAENILGCLRTVKTLTSNFHIVPFVSILQSIDEPVPFADEVEAVLDIPLIQLLSTMAPDVEHIAIDELYKFEYDSYLVWGATARILKQLHAIILPQTSTSSNRGM